jgi:hypothetical protein
VNSVLLAVFQTKPAAAHRFVSVLVAAPVPVSVAVFDAVPASVAESVAEPVPVAVFDAVPVPVAEPVSVTVSDAPPVAVATAVLVPELGTLASLAASAAGEPSMAPVSAASGAASAASGWLLLPLQHGVSRRTKANITHRLAKHFFHMGLPHPAAKRRARSSKICSRMSDTGTMAASHRRRWTWAARRSFSVAKSTSRFALRGIGASLPHFGGIHSL